MRPNPINMFTSAVWGRVDIPKPTTNRRLWHRNVQINIFYWRQVRDKSCFVCSCIFNQKWCLNLFFIFSKETPMILCMLHTKWKQIFLSIQICNTNIKRLLNCGDIDLNILHVSFVYVVMVCKSWPECPSCKCLT